MMYKEWQKIIEEDFEKTDLKEVVLIPDISKPDERYLVLRDNYKNSLLGYIKYYSFDNKNNFLSSLYHSVYSEKYDNRDVNADSLTKNITRIHNRVICGEKSVKNSDRVASDKTCFRYLQAAEKFLGQYVKIELLQKLPVEDIPNYYENRYIALLVFQLIDMMNDSDLYNFIQGTTNYQRLCYKNHLQMILNNIKNIYSDKPDVEDKWMEVIKPLCNIINGDYPGIEMGIWIEVNPNLRFFDCVYDIAKNCELYIKIKQSNKAFKFDLGNNIEAVHNELKKQMAYFKEKQETNNKSESTLKKEKTLFFKEFKKTYVEIVYKNFSIKI